MTKINQQSLPPAEHGDTSSNIISYFSLAVVSLLTSLLAFTKIFEDDVFWHLATGRWIWQNKTIPDTDVFGFLTKGERWIPFEWGWDVITYLIYSVGDSYFTVQLFVALCWLIIVLLLYYVLRKLRISDTPATVLLLVTVFVSVSRMTPRPQLITLVGLSIVCSIIYLYRYSSSPSRRIVYSLPFIFFVWANMHPGVLAGFLLLGLFLLSELLSLFLSKRDKKRSTTPSQIPSNGRLKTLVLSAAFCILAVSLNPHGIDTFRYIVSHASMGFLSAIQEWTPPFQLAIKSPIVTFYSIALAFGSLSIFYSIKTKDPLPVILYIGFGIYSLQAIRFVSDFAIVSLIGSALSLDLLFKQLPDNIRRATAGKGVKLTFAILSLILCVTVYNGSLYRNLGVDIRFGYGIDERYFSIPLLEFMKRHTISGRPFNQFDIGGQLIWELPEEKNFIDSRNLNDNIGNLYASIINMQPGFDEALQKCGVDYIVLHVRDLRESATNMKYSLVPYCSTNRTLWKLVYWDDQSFLYLKNIPKFKSIIEKEEYQILDPYVFVFKPQEFDSLSRSNPDIFYKELQRKIKEEPAGVIVNFIAKSSNIQP